MPEVSGNFFNFCKRKFENISTQLFTTIYNNGYATCYSATIPIGGIGGLMLGSRECAEGRWLHIGDVAQHLAPHSGEKPGVVVDNDRSVSEEFPVRVRFRTGEGMANDQWVSGRSLRRVIPHALPYVRSR